MIRGTEYVVDESPFIVRRQVRWGDCDPAGVVYTGRMSDYVLGAISLFNAYLAGSDGSMLGEKYGVATPCKGMTFEFISALWPGDVVDLECSVGEVRTKSYDFLITARTPDNTPVFIATFSPVCMRTDARIGIAIPRAMREVLVEHMHPHLDAGTS